MRLSLILSALLLLSCARDIVGEDPPADRAHFPLGAVLHPTANALLVVSSNFDLAFNRGMLLFADLDVVDAALAGQEDSIVVVNDAYTAASFIPSFGNRPVLTQDGSRALLATRAENRISDFDIGTEPLTVGCGQSGDVESCGEAPRAIQLPGDDPFDIVITDEGEKVRAATALLSGPEIIFVDLDPTRDDAARLRLVSPTLTLGDWLQGDDFITGVRSLLLRPGSPNHLFAAVERSRDTRASADLVWFRAEPNASRVDVLSIEDNTGARGVRAMTMSENGDAIFLLLRNPDAIARINVREVGTRLEANFAGVAATCDEPTRIASARFDADFGEAERIFVTCFGDDAVIAYDGDTLEETDAIRFFGRGPFDVVPDALRSRLYVTYFDDDSVGVFDLTDADGKAKLIPRGRIGAQRPKVEDGRQ